MTEILLIRHGETSWNVARRLQGHIDVALNEEGLRQAAALGLALRHEKLDAIISSDLQRALQTAQAVAQWQSAPVQHEPDLRERCYGAFEGLTHREISERYPDAYTSWQARAIDVALPDGARRGESFRQFYTRALAAILRCAQQHPGRKIALVAHGGVLECAYRAAHAMPLHTPRTFPVLNASINRLAVRDDALHLIAWGEVAHLQSRGRDEVDLAASIKN